MVLVRLPQSAEGIIETWSRRVSQHRAGQWHGVQLLEERQKSTRASMYSNRCSFVAKVASKTPNSPSKNASAETQLARTQGETVWVT